MFGLTAGFLLAYQRSSCKYSLNYVHHLCKIPFIKILYHSYVKVRFWGWTENFNEVEKDRQEMTKLLERGEPLYGTTHMSEFNQKASSWITKYAALKFCK